MGLFRGKELGIPLECELTHWRKALPFLPSYKGNTITYHTDSGKSPLTLALVSKVGEGTFGTVYSAIRQDAEDQETVIVKKMKVPQLRMAVEGILQFYAHNCFEVIGYKAHIPKVYDICREWNSDLIYIVMEDMRTARGKTVADWLVDHPRAEMMFAYLVAQAAILFDALEKYAGMDHRDLKPDNLLIQAKPASIQIGKRAVKFPFTLSIIDFGFCCVGDVDGSKGAFPALDPCPKEGRDMFQFLVSLWSIPKIRSKLSPFWDDWMRQHLLYNGKDHKKQAEFSTDTDWIYGISAKKDFHSTACLPAQILTDLSADEWLEWE